MISLSLLNRVNIQVSGEKPIHSTRSWGVSKVLSRSRVIASRMSIVVEESQATAMNRPHGDHAAVAIRARW